MATSVRKFSPKQNKVMISFQESTNIVSPINKEPVKFLKVAYDVPVNNGWSDLVVSRGSLKNNFVLVDTRHTEKK